jgi:hypothetical protein
MNPVLRHYLVFELNNELMLPQKGIVRLAYYAIDKAQALKISQNRRQSG